LRRRFSSRQFALWGTEVIKAITAYITEDEHIFSTHKEAEEHETEMADVSLRDAITSFLSANYREGSLDFDGFIDNLTDAYIITLKEPT